MPDSGPANATPFGGRIDSWAHEHDLGRTYLWTNISLDGRLFGPVCGRLAENANPADQVLPPSRNVPFVQS